MKIADFILSRLDEEEMAARAATPGSWIAGGLPWSLRDIVSAPDYRPKGFSEGQHVAECRAADGGMGPWAADLRGSGFPQGNADHIARHDPARVLRQVMAMRSLVALIEAERHFYVDEDTWYSCPQASEPDNPEPGSGCGNENRAGLSCDCGLDKRVFERLAAIAAIWSDHQDYDPEWAPE